MGNPYCRHYLSLLLGLSIGLRIGCAPVPKKAAEVVPKVTITPAPPREELPEELVARQPERRREKLFSFSGRDLDIREVLLTFSQAIEQNIIVDPDVSGTVTVDLKNVTLEEALTYLLSPLKLQYKMEDRPSRFIRVSVLKTETRLFTLNYVSTARTGAGSISAAGGAGTGSASISTTDQANLWTDIESGLSTMLSTEGKFLINRLAGIILVTDYPENLDVVGKFLEDVEGSMQRQVMINATIAEVTLDERHQMGIDWSILPGASRLLPKELSLTQALKATEDIFKLTVTGESVTVLLNGISQSGDLKILSKPQISTLNNQKAIIKVGREDVYFTPQFRTITITNPATGEVTGTQSVLTSVTPQSVTEGIVLDVTPQISSDGLITMNIHPSITEFVRQAEFRSGGELLATAPVTDVREANVVVKARDGETILIGGLMRDKESNRATSVPLLGDIPFLGRLFRGTEVKREKSELVIMLTPTVHMGWKMEGLSMADWERVKDGTSGLRLPR